ncbi:hypothetical protein NliqN6_6335 [Naganishia liquefaciens]|uniref:Phosphatase activator n=1 Tax=Naganishia liquefaciens TaxID=104408 RepID=A0A8H3YI17_9TREE|nr:hypothetical protein NliqN6_6335 [Naganishia liquefaciens]
MADPNNPITSVAPSSSPITSVLPSYPPSYHSTGANGNQLLNRLVLEMRGERIPVERDTLMNLPESILLALFPNGLLLSRPPMMDGDGLGMNSAMEHDQEDGHTFAVDFDPGSFEYVLGFFRRASDAFYGDAKHPGLYTAQQSLLPSSIMYRGPQPGTPGFDHSLEGNPLIVKQPIIVLREELEYFAIPPTNVHGVTAHPLAGKAMTNASGQPSPELLRIKRECGRALMDRKKVFTALQRNVSKEGNLAEQHLIDMLCTSGFSRDDEWGYRALEPSRCCISSISLVLLNTGIEHRRTTMPSMLAKGGSSDDTSSDEGLKAHEETAMSTRVTLDDQQMNTAQKLLLFWRKPARKCWWDGVEVEIPMGGDSKELGKIKVWARRVWTLELSLI